MTVHDVAHDLYRETRLPEPRQEEYDRRFGRALWLDRAEVVEVLQQDWFGGSVGADAEEEAMVRRAAG